MLQCIVLAALLHALLVALLGSATGGTARPGEGVWGPINVTLRGLAETGTGPVLPPNAYSGPTGSARERRFGGAVREEHEAPRSNDGPGAARIGVWSSTPSPSATEVAPGALSPPRVAPADVSTAAPLERAQVAAIEGLTRVLPVAPLRRAMPTAVVPAANLATQPTAAPQTSTRAPSISERVAPRSAESRPSDIPRAAPAENDARLKMVQSPPAPALADPVAPAPPVPVSHTAVAERKIEPVSLPVSEPLTAPAPVEIKALTAPARLASAPALAERLLPLRVEPATLPTLADAPVAPRALLDAPVEIKALPTLPGPASAAAAASTARAQPLEAAPRAPSLVVPNLQAVPSVSAASLPAIASAPTSVPTSVPTSAPTSASSLTRSPTSTAAAPDGSPGATATSTQPSVGSPNAGPQLGRDVATAPSAPASAPRLNLDLVRPRGGEIARQGSRGVLQLLPLPPERKSKLAEGIEQAAKKDCKDAYSPMGILAVVPLALDAVKSNSATGCKW